MEVFFTFLVAVAAGVRVPVGVLGTIRPPESPIVGQASIMALLAARHFNARNATAVPQFGELGDCDVYIDAEFVDTDLCAPARAARPHRRRIGTHPIPLRAPAAPSACLARIGVRPRYCEDAVTQYGLGVIPEDGWRAIIGESYSGCSASLATLGRVFDTVQVAASSTSPSLDDATLYPLFARTVPSDIGVMYAVSRYILQHGWQRVGILYSGSVYARDLNRGLSELLVEEQIDVLSALYRFGDQSSIRRAVAELALGIRGVRPRIIVAVTSSSELPAIADYALEYGLIGEGRHWIFTDGSQFGEAQQMRNGHLYDGSAAFYAAGERVGNPRWAALAAEWATYDWADFAPDITIPRANLSVVEWGFDTQLGIYAAFGYDAMAAVALGLCATGGDTTGSVLFPAVVGSSFLGASGTVEFETSGSRDPTSAPLILENVQHASASDLIHVRQTGSFDGDSWDIDAYGDFHFFGGTRAPPDDSRDARNDGGADDDGSGGGGGGGGGSGGSDGRTATVIANSSVEIESFFIALYSLAGLVLLVLCLLGARKAIRARKARTQLAAEEVAATLEANSREVAMRARSRLIRTVMHDLRSPLISITSLASTLVLKPKGTLLESVCDELEAVELCAGLMEHIVSDMLGARALRRLAPSPSCRLVEYRHSRRHSPPSTRNMGLARARLCYATCNQRHGRP
jgi:ABC-type branched-subunit amino acid transport system substrate-binding protein